MSSTKYVRECIKCMHRELDSKSQSDPKDEILASVSMEAFFLRPFYQKFDRVNGRNKLVWVSNPFKGLLKHYKSSDDYSKGVRSFSPFFIQRVMRLIRLMLPTLEVISVGSGMGKVERLMEILHSSYEQKNSVHKTNVICIDPDPMSFSSGKRSQPYHLVDYSTVSDMVSKLGFEALGHILFLNWCPFGDSTFDHGAIVDLQPTVIVAVFETFAGESGCAGGTKFFEWFQMVKSGKCDTYVIEKSCYCFNGGLSLIFSVIRKRTCRSLGLGGLREYYEPYTSFGDGLCSIM